jgi:hypothetical protein
MEVEGMQDNGAPTAEWLPLNRIDELVEEVIAIHDPELAAERAPKDAKGKPIKRVPGRALTYDASRAGTLQYGETIYSERGFLLAKIGACDINRPLNDQRVTAFGRTIAADRWLTNPDPIVITTDGQILNGQHRIAAAVNITWEQGDRVPMFLVIRNADPRVAVMMDEAARNRNDRREIALGLVNAR